MLLLLTQQSVKIAQVINMYAHVGKTYTSPIIRVWLNYVCTVTCRNTSSVSSVCRTYLSSGHVKFDTDDEEISLLLAEVG